MPIVVQKYGGSSVADIEKLGLVADKVVAAKKAGDEVVVVVSAMGKTTDQLLALAKQIDETPPRRELDMLLTTGERVSMALLSMAIQKRGFEAISFTGSQSGIITNDRHFDARIIEVRPHRIEDEISRGKIVIIAGYQGMSYRREITTLGRGGSDTTAIAMAAALGAERAEIYSDVDGVYTADPRVVPNAQHLPELSYSAMQSMADAGAKVLNATAVEFAKNAKISIHARSTFAPGKETRVSESACEHNVSAVVGQKSVIQIRSDDASGAQAAFAHCQSMGIPALNLGFQDGSWSFVVCSGLVPDWSIHSRQLQNEFRVHFEYGLGLVTVVGKPSATLGALDALPPAQTIVNANHSAERLMLTTREDEVDDLVRTLHQELLGVQANPV